MFFAQSCGVIDCNEVSSRDNLHQFLTRSQYALALKLLTLYVPVLFTAELPRITFVLLLVVLCTNDVNSTGNWFVAAASLDAEQPSFPGPALRRPPF